MKSILIIVTITISTLISHAQAGPIATTLLLMEGSKPAPAAAVAVVVPPAPLATIALPVSAPVSTGNLSFDNAKAKCIALGNKNGSNAFNSCIVTLMQ